MQKTIFIIVSRSFITRNILRSGVLDLLKKSGHKMIIFFQADHIPEYIRQEFQDDQVELVPIQININGVLRRLTKLKDYLIYTDTTKLRIKFYVGKKSKEINGVFLSEEHGLATKIRLSLSYITSKIYFLKPLSRWIDLHMFPERNKKIQEYFDKYNPNLVFSTSIISMLDATFWKEAKRRNIKTISMPKGWDNVTNGYYRFVPDYFLVPNQLFADIACDLQDVPEKNIHVVGLPQFDWYKKPEIIRSRKAHFEKKGLDPSKALLFFGSEGLWALNDHKAAEAIYEWVKNNELVKPCQLLVRPHYSNVKSDVFKNLRNKKDVVVDDFRIVDFLVDRWDPNVPEMIDFVNSIYHCDVLINTSSTLSLDAACLDKPVINIGFGCEFAGNKDITEQKTYGSDHMQWMLSTRGTSKVNSLEELKKEINNYLANPDINAHGREILREKLCFKVDGLSSRRVVNVINKILS